MAINMEQFFPGAPLIPDAVFAISFLIMAPPEMPSTFLLTNPQLSVFLMLT
jgi:hypothetical protein